MVQKGLQYIDIETDLENNKRSFDNHVNSTDKQQFTQTELNNNENKAKRAKLNHNSISFSAPTNLQEIKQQKNNNLIRIDSKPIEENYKIKPKLTYLNGHKAEVFSCEWNPTIDNLLASGAGDGTVRLWKYLDNGKYDVVAVLEHDKTACIGGCLPCDTVDPRSDVTTLDWSSDGQYLCSGDATGRARLFDSKGRLIKVLCGHKGTIFCVRFNKSGNKLITASYDKTVVVWDINTVLKQRNNSTVSEHVEEVMMEMCDIVENRRGKMFMHCTLTQHSSPVLDASWRDDNILATCSADNYVYITHVNDSSRVPLRLDGHKGEVNAIRWSSCGTMLASACDDLTSFIWSFDVTTFTVKTLHHLKGHKKEIFTCKWSPNGKMLATVGFDSTVHLWDVFAGQCIRVIRHQAEVYAVSFSHENRYLCSGSIDRSISVYDIQTKEVITQATTRGNVFEVHFHNKKSNLIAACCGLPGNEICILNLEQT